MIKSNKKAICLFGLIRGNEKSWRCLFKFIKENQLDVYAHFWVPNYVVKTWHKSSEKNIHLNFLKYAKKNNIIFKKLLIESQDENASFEERYKFHKNQYFMWNSIVKSKDLVEKWQYKYIFFTRTDLEIRKNIIIKNEFMEDKFELLHSGHIRDNKIECEDLFFALRTNKLDILNEIQNKTIEGYYFENGIRNPLLLELKSDFYRLFEYNNNIFIKRNKNYISKLRERFFE